MPTQTEEPRQRQSPVAKPYIVDLKGLADRDGDKLRLTELGQRDRHGRRDVANAPVRLEELRVRGGRHGDRGCGAGQREWRGTHGSRVRCRGVPTAVGAAPAESSQNPGTRCTQL